MKPLQSRAFQRWLRYGFLSTAIVVFVFDAVFLISILTQAGRSSDLIQTRLGFGLFLFSFPVLLGWLGFQLAGALFFVISAAIFSVLTSWTIQNPSFLLFVFYPSAFCFLFFFFDQKKNGQMVACEVEIEKMMNEWNDLELAYKEKGTSISVSFDKYASYYNLRNLANDFSATLSLTELGKMIVDKTLALVGKGDSCFLFLSDPETGSLSLCASKSIGSETKPKVKLGELFDLWILRNRQSLIVNDTQKDFRFDLKKTVATSEARSLVSSPLIHEGKAVGTLRVNSSNPAVFTTDDLRLLDAISTLASSAVSNAILFRRTEELAIRDSLTGVYVRRYFLDRLNEEHRRSLLTKIPLTLLMCDLDYFKQANDRYGHGIGDFLLTKTAELFLRETKHGMVGRYGGEEFSVLLPNVSLSDGRVFAEQLRSLVSSMNLAVRREVIPITISIGVASIPSDTLDSEELIRIADQRLYEAKKAGRNRVC